MSDTSKSLIMAHGCNGEKHSTRQHSYGLCRPHADGSKNLGAHSSCAVGILRVRVRLCRAPQFSHSRHRIHPPMCSVAPSIDHYWGKSVGRREAIRLFQAANCQRSQLGALTSLLWAIIARFWRAGWSGRVGGSSLQKVQLALHGRNRLRLMAAQQQRNAHSPIPFGRAHVP